MLIDGKKIAGKIFEDIKKEVSRMSKKPALGALLVGDNSSSIRYIEQKKKWAEYVGIKFILKKLPEHVSENEILSTIESFNTDDNISGYIVQLPLPSHIDEKKIIKSISPKKDVDGFHPENQGKLMIGDKTGFSPCTPAGILELLKSTEIDYIGKQVVVIGRSNIVGKPITTLLINEGATVISCNSKTPNIRKFTIDADIVISAAGKPGLLTLDMIKKDAIVIDVGFTVIEGKIYGDADTHNMDLAGVKVTPVPGGVGPLTVAMLMKNTLKSGK
ncbi:MAG: bifunctional 5,10-methylenetetrahydrofolate dehydrogenase/5,10-methenyltetrahydrofolate cyclohydrolase [Candidatus Gracilibacteria bacterium]|nr:bifunctional 5,10-methylenetetrahydrofolate dehydrogenase/5,10-methenyltetrahydrofolate cyclohydrolase [Candidatus Gracilibacteria bacterium]